MSKILPFPKYNGYTELTRIPPKTQVCPEPQNVNLFANAAFADAIN